MAGISDDDATFIASNPLAAALDPLRASLQAGTSSSADKTTDLSASRDVIASILFLLAGQPVARRLRSNRQRPLDSLLAGIYSRLRSDDFDLSLLEPLTRAVETNASDFELWKAVLRLADNLARVTPPPSNSIPLSYQGTPRTRSSASHQGSDQTRRDLEQPLRYELSDSTFENVTGFYAKYFEGKEWCTKAAEVCQELRKANDGDVLKGYPKTHLEDDIWAWLDVFQARHLSQSPSLYLRTTSKGQTTAEAERQLDLLVQPRSIPTGKRIDMRHVRVVGELTSSDKGKAWLAKFIQLATYVRDVFTSQPIRRFVHSFLLFDCEMQLWVFDRSGAYSSETFNIFDQPERFVHVLVGYAFMTEEELGCDTFIQRNGHGATVDITDAATEENRTIEVEAMPFVLQRSIVSRATACYLANKGKLVIKCSWPSAERKPESDYLRAAKGVSAVGQLEGWRDITSTKDLRQGLTFTRKMQRKISLNDSANPGSAQLSFTSQSAKSLGTLNISGSKRGSVEDTDLRDHKRSRRSSLRNEVAASDEPNCSSKIKDPAPLFRHRTFTCIAISPAGRPLRDFKTVEELLRGMRDAICGHKSLFMQRRILHRDVSAHNIILTDPKECDGFSGALIDLDQAVFVAKDGKNEKSGSRAMTGTLEYMALEVLEGGLELETAGIEHTYRHDLESFFYVFVSVCMRHGWKDGESPRVDPLQSWYTGSIKSIYAAKRGAVEPGGFGKIVLANFSPEFVGMKPFARELREILFSKGALQTGTDEDPRYMYEATIKAYDGALRAIRS